jgi:hypothetical protein
MKHIKLFVIIIFFYGCTSLYSQNRWSSKYVFYGKNGKLEYLPDSLGNIIPDFSHVGYKYGDEAIPNVPVKATVEPVDGDALSVIQAAIESLYDTDPDENGFRGAVLIKSGTYEVDGIITINQSGIVLRGEGNTEQGTRIIATGLVKRPLIQVGVPSSLNIELASIVNISEPYVPVGRKFVVIESAAAYAVGDHISLFRPGTQNWISDIQMDQIPPRADGGAVTQWSPTSYNFHFERTITDIRGDTIFFRNPVVMAMETQYGGGKVYKATRQRIQNIGVEYMLLESVYASDTDENHAWDAVMFRNAEHGWARFITAKYFGYSCVNLERESRYITVTDCKQLEPKSLITGSRRYSFNNVGQKNLFISCFASEGRHDYATSSRVPGPNVFTNSEAERAHSDIGPHHRWAMGSLYDQIISDGAINVRDRGNLGSGHGWAGVNHVVWNSAGSEANIQNPWVSALNYAIGFRGRKIISSPPRPDALWEGHNQVGLFPSSLYLAQLHDRLSDTIFFSVHPYLEQESDSAFLMRFNFAPNPNEAANPKNYTIGGNANVADNLFLIEMADTSTVRFIFKGLGLLDALSNIQITAQDITSLQGYTLNALKTSWFFEPDKRPVITSAYQEVTNDPGEFVIASTSKHGKIWLIQLGKPSSNIQELQNSIAEGFGKGINANIANREYSVITEGLNPAFYSFYATDSDGRVSIRSINLVHIKKGLSTHLSSPDDGRFAIIPINNGIKIMPDKAITNYSAEIFDLSGRSLFVTKSISGDYIFNIEDTKGIHIIRIISDKKVITKKIMLNP